MAPITSTTKFTSPVPPAKLFKALFLDDKHIHKIVPQAIKSVEILKGDGGVGTIKLTTFAEGSPVKSAKHRVEAIDKEKFVYCYSLIESDALKEGIEKFTDEVKFEASPDGGSIGKITSTVYAKAGVQITEEEIKAGKEKSLGMFKAVEAHILANPGAY